MEGDTGVAKTGDGISHQFSIKLGNFGDADPDIVKSTGQEVYNVEFSYNIVRTFTELGVISKDGLKITVISNQYKLIHIKKVAKQVNNNSSRLW